MEEKGQRNGCLRLDAVWHTKEGNAQWLGCNFRPATVLGDFLVPPCCSVHLLPAAGLDRPLLAEDTSRASLQYLQWKSPLRGRYMQNIAQLCLLKSKCCVLRGSETVLLWAVHTQTQAPPHASWVSWEWGRGCLLRAVCFITLFTLSDCPRD